MDYTGPERRTRPRTQSNHTARLRASTSIQPTRTIITREMASKSGSDRNRSGDIAVVATCAEPRHSRRRSREIRAAAATNSVNRYGRLLRRCLAIALQPDRRWCLASTPKSGTAARRALNRNRSRWAEFARRAVDSGSQPPIARIRVRYRLERPRRARLWNHFAHCGLHILK